MPEQPPRAFNRTHISNLRESINTALAEVGRRYGVSIRASTCHFTPSTFRFVLEGGLTGADGRSDSPERVFFRRYARVYGFSPSDLDRTVVFQGRTFTLAGIKRGGRSCTLVEAGSYRRYKLSSRAVLQYFAQQSARLPASAARPYPLNYMEDEPSNNVSAQSTSEERMADGQLLGAPALDAVRPEEEI